MNLLFLLFIFSSTLAQPIKEFINHKDNKNQKIEFHWIKPKGDGPFPLLLTIHSGEKFANLGGLRALSEIGYVAILILQPGYGESTGPIDYSGPNSQNAVITLLDHFASKSFVNKKKMALYGYSKGALVASMVSAKYPSLAASILVAGFYDVEEAKKRFEKGAGISKVYTEMLTWMNDQMGNSPNRFTERSALFHAAKIKVPTLIMNGEKDEYSFPDQARKLGELIRKNGIESRVVILPNHAHEMAFKDVKGELLPFLEKHLKSP